MTSRIVISNFLFLFFLACALVLYSFMRWSDRCATRRHRGEAQEAATFTILTGPRDRSHTEPCGKASRVVRRQKTRAWGRFRPLPLLGFLGERQSRAE